MRSLVILLALSLSSSALAEKRKALPVEKDSSTKVSKETSTRSDGSLWDFIERPTIRPQESAEAETSPRTLKPKKTQDVSDERVVEKFSPTIAIHGRPDAGFYLNPVKVLELDPLHLAGINPDDFDIPIVINDDVKRWMSYYTGRGRGYFTKWLERKGQYDSLFTTTLAEAGLPQDLAYLSMIESGYKTHAYSRAAAAGLWQFISPTAKEWGLRVDWWVDERRDPELATQAATRFLGALYKRYGDWYLAWAAYNGGPGRVDRAIAKYGTRDFWTLVEKGAFPAETDNYVPKLLAAAIVAHYPERYGFTEIVPQPALAYDTVEVEPNIGLDVLARCANSSIEKMQSLNPHLRQGALPPEPKAQFLHVPVGTGDDFLATLAKVPASERLSFQEHKVAKGESLGVIAQRYGLTLQDIQRVNQIDNPNRISVGMRLIIPTAGSGKNLVAGTPSGKSPAKAKKVTHVVRSGEALSSIAARYSVKQSDIMQWNGIDNANRINAGQRLKLYEPATQWRGYTVMNGDSLSTIAARNGCSVDELKNWNNLKSTRIYAGQKLKIRQS